jgi:probable rRNA maturation factor
VTRHRVEVTDLQRRRRVERGALERAAVAALMREGAPATRVSVVLMSDRQIAEPHERWLGEPGATDVISFRYPSNGPDGPDVELLVSVERAAREADRRGIPLRRELARYVVHGVLHALGYRDADAASRRAMFRVQEGIVRELEDSRPAPRRTHQRRGQARRAATK